jgi:hypothetical protein
MRGIRMPVVVETTSRIAEGSAVAPVALMATDWAKREELRQRRTAINISAFLMVRVAGCAVRGDKKSKVPWFWSGMI